MQMSTVLAIPICAGTVGRLSDASAASLQKVRVDMRWLRHIYAESGGPAQSIWPLERIGNFFVGILTIYPVDTAWLTGPGTSGETRQLDWAATLVPLGVGVSISATGDRE